MCSSVRDLPGRCRHNWLSAWGICFVFNRLVILGGTVILLALALDWLAEGPEAPADSIPSGEADAYMIDARIDQYSQAGDLQHQIIAKRLNHNPRTDLVTLVAPAVRFKDKESGGAWEVTSATGRILPRGEGKDQAVELIDQVEANKPGPGSRFISIKTNSLTLYPDRQYAETDDQVVIVNERSRTSAHGMRAYLDEGRFLFFSTPEAPVTTSFQAAPRKQPEQ